MPWSYTVGHLINLAEQHFGAVVEEQPIQLDDGHIMNQRAIILERNGRMTMAQLGTRADSDFLDADIVRSLCRQLGIPSLEFGIPLGEEED